MGSNVNRKRRGERENREEKGRRVDAENLISSTAARGSLPFSWINPHLSSVWTGKGLWCCAIMGVVRKVVVC